MPYARKRVYRRRYPYRRRVRKTTSRTYRRRKPTRKILRKRALWKNPLPERGYYKFTYNDINFLWDTPAITYQTYHQFRGNSLYDPDLTGAGVQPYGFDQITANFGANTRYKVYASKITIIPTVFRDTGAATQVRILCFPFRGTGTPTYISPTDMLRMLKVKTLTVRSEDNNGRTKLVNYCPTKFLYKDSPYDNDLSAAAVNSPTNTWTWYVSVDTIQQLLQGSVNCDVKIKYYCVMIRTDNVDQS